MGEEIESEIEITRHADFMPIYGDLLASPRATLFTKEGYENTRRISYKPNTNRTLGFVLP